MEVMNARLTSMDEEIKSLKSKDKPEKEKVVKDTSFGGVFGHLLVNSNGEPFRVKHSAEEKNGEDDEWYAVWDARAKVFAREGTDETYNSPSQFGEAHNTLSLNNPKHVLPFGMIMSAVCSSRRHTW